MCGLLKQWLCLPGTFKLKKKDLQVEGYDPRRINDKLYYLDPKTGYESLTPDAYDQIQSGKIRFWGDTQCSTRGEGQWLSSYKMTNKSTEPEQMQITDTNKWNTHSEHVFDRRSTASLSLRNLPFVNNLKEKKNVRDGQ